MVEQNQTGRTDQNWTDWTDQNQTEKTDQTGPDQSDIRGAEASQKKRNSEDPSGSIRDITDHLIYDKNTSIAVPCIAFNEESAGYDPGWINWSSNLFFF